MTWLVALLLLIFSGGWHGHHHRWTPTPTPTPTSIPTGVAARRCPTPLPTGYAVSTSPPGTPDPPTRTPVPVRADCR